MFAFNLMNNVMKAKENSEMTFLEHLEELRWHIIRSAVVIVVLSVIAFIFKYILFDIIILGPSRSDFITNVLLCRLGEKVNAPGLCVSPKPIVLQSLEMAGQFTAHIKISLIAGLILAAPYIVYEVWKFISPALYLKERKIAQGTVFAVSFLFFLGVLFGYFVICPLSIRFLLNYKVSEVAQNNIRLMNYVSMVSGLSLASGLTFELPVLVYILSKLGILTPSFLIRYRRHAIIIILLVAGIITPSPDIFSQVLVSIPLLLLYEVSIIVSKRISRKRNQSILK
jgi:sec-independent protein translocase protein TatC